jgi:hypothetical protein
LGGALIKWSIYGFVDWSTYKSLHYKDWYRYREFGGANAAEHNRGLTAKTQSGVVTRSSRPHTSRIVVHVYALSQFSIDAFVKEIENMLNEFIWDEDWGWGN